MIARAKCKSSQLFEGLPKSNPPEKDGSNDELIAVVAERLDKAVFAPPLAGNAQLANPVASEQVSTLPAAGTPPAIFICPAIYAFLHAFVELPKSMAFVV